MVFGFVADTFLLFWGLFWHVWYLLPYTFVAGFVAKMYVCSTTTDSDNYKYSVEYRPAVKLLIQSFVETVGFYTGLVNSLLGLVNMAKALLMGRLGVTRKAVGGGLNPAAFAAMMMQNISKREAVEERPSTPKPRSPSLRKAIRHPHAQPPSPETKMNEGTKED